jgi:hypothetical protein
MRDHGLSVLQCPNGVGLSVGLTMLANLTHLLFSAPGDSGSVARVGAMELDPEKAARSGMHRVPVGV